jgi:hypothetical protein
VGVRDVLAVAAIVAGVAWLAAVGPDASSHHVGGWPLAAALAALAVAALVPYAARGRVGGIAMAISAGAAFACSGLTTKFVADAVGTGQWLTAAAWTLATGLGSGLAVLSEMSALQRRQATHVAPLVFVVQVAIPVLAAPLLTGESWAHAPLGPAGILAGLAVVIGGAVALTAAPAVRSLVDVEGSSVASDTARSPMAPSEATAASPGAAAPPAVTTTMSPGDGAAGSGRDASTVNRPATGDASTLRARRY